MTSFKKSMHYIWRIATPGPTVKEIQEGMNITVNYMKINPGMQRKK